jgi:type II secretory pathway pseudopilin PulG
VDNYWTIILIIGAIALAVGPVMMLQPSQRSRRLSELRQAAAQLSIRIRLSTITLPLGKKEVAVYSLSLPTNDTVRSQWALIKQDYTHGANFHNEWAWENPKQAAPDFQHATLREILASLDCSIVGIEMTHNTLGVYWHEKSLTIEQINQLLTAYRDKLAST